MNDTTQWNAYCRAKAEAHRALAAAFRADAIAAQLDPYQQNLADKLAHLAEMEANYLALAKEQESYIEPVTQEIHA